MITDTRTTVVERESALVMPLEHRINWGAIFAGLFLFLALSWLLMLLGAALGVGIADATDLEAMGDGLGLGAIIWMLLTTLIAVFAGAVLAASLAGSTDDRTGALHGLTLWSTTTIALLFLAASGIGGAVNTVSGIVASGTDIGATVIKGATGGEDGDLLPDFVTTSVSAALKRQASQTISENAAGDGPQPAEVRQAIDELSAEDTGAIASALVSGNDDQARQELQNRTNLSADEIDSIVAGAEQEMENWQESDAAQQAENWLDEQMSDARQAVSSSVADMAGPEVSASEVSQAMRELDSDTLAQAAQYLVTGEPERAKDVLVANTNLESDDIDAIVDGAEQEVDQMVSKAKAELDQATEVAGKYAQATLWTAFVAACLGALAGIFGGYIGAHTVRRVYAVA